MKRTLRQRQAGAAVVEFALVFILLLMLMAGLLEFGRALYQWNSSVEATRHGARVASIAPPNAAGRAQVLAAIRETMPDVTDAELQVHYSTDGISFAAAGSCTRDTTPPCTFVRVGLDRRFTFAARFWGTPDGSRSMSMPRFSTTVPIEALGVT